MVIKNVKKNIFNLVFLFLVFGLTIYGVFKGEDITRGCAGHSERTI